HQLNPRTLPPRSDTTTGSWDVKDENRKQPVYQSLRLTIAKIKLKLVVFFVFCVATGKERVSNMTGSG
ncbi:hypothetical protein, partial [Mesorhizobium sp. M7A.F.Ca.CA.001.05.1.1]|uniref:hypothetical protein n=1 Tax=Mesorhizobium sp. M7A.F.Ca.CA.001.05.1.1 TaxID=2496721 RepID=UPI0019D091C6